MKTRGFSKVRPSLKPSARAPPPRSLPPCCSRMGFRTEGVRTRVTEVRRQWKRSEEGASRLPAKYRNLSLLAQKLLSRQVRRIERRSCRGQNFAARILGQREAAAGSPQLPSSLLGSAFSLKCFSFTQTTPLPPPPAPSVPLLETVTPFKNWKINASLASSVR